MRSLYVRVLLVTIYTIAISSLLGFYVANVYYHWKLKPYNDAKLTAVAGQIRDFLERHPHVMEDYLQQAAKLGYQLYVRDERGGDFFYGGAFRKLDLPEQAIADVLAGHAYHGVAEFPNNPFITGFFENRLSNSVGVLVAAGEGRYALFVRPDIRLQFGELRVFFALIVVLSVLFSIPYFLISTKYLVQPITSLIEATKRIAQGDYNLELPIDRRDEIGQLASHFRKMSAQLERSDRAKKEFVANVSHEIHSPLASIQGFADSLQRPDIDDSQRRYYAGVIGQETRQLAALTRQLLLLSTLDHVGDAVKKRRYAIGPQLRQALQLQEWQLTEKGIAVRLHVAGQAHICGDEVLLMQVWSNLLSNAVRHIPEGRSIEIRAWREAAACGIAISDTGDGIPEHRLPYIFDRFYRGDDARQRGTGSTGLGLSIVRQIVHLHGGEIEVQSRDGQGTVFQIRIPDDMPSA